MNRGARNRIVAFGSTVAGSVLVALALFLSCPLADDSTTDTYGAAQVDGDRVTFELPVFPEGSCSVTVEGFEDTLQPGAPLEWTVRVEMDGVDLGPILERVEELRLVLAAGRMADADGHFRSASAYFGSTYLTPSGMPVEGFQYYIPSSSVGGPYRTPLDHAQQVPLEAIRADGRGLSFGARVSTTLAAGFPPGLYRIELALFAAVDGVWTPIHVLPAVGDPYTGACDLDYETLYYTRLMLPPTTVGSLETPRAIWTLFTSAIHNGVPGVVAAEDAGEYALSARVKPGTRYRLPCHPGGEPCVMPLEPELPTVKLGRFHQSTLEPDFERGQASIAVTRPDGTVEDLGTHAFRTRPTRALQETDLRWRLHTGVEYAFEQPGRYEVVLKGEMFDRFGNRYEGGGSYEVWLAHPLTFATGVKPANPMRVGEFYPVAATINPPVPADVVTTVRFFPGIHPEDVIEERYAGRAQRFGYFHPDPSHQPLIFPETGEYLFDIFAEYTAPDGQVFMGHMRNASVVLPGGEPGMEIWGRPDSEHSPGFAASSFTLGGEANTLAIGPLTFPHRSGDNLYFEGNGPFVQFVQLFMSVSEPSGALQRVLRSEFPPGLIRLQRGDAAPTRELLDYRAFPGPVGAIDRYAADDDGRHLPLMSTTTEGYSPFEYPERVDRAGYFYLASSRPGFPVFFAVADSTITENYWMNAFSGYEHTLGAALRGDQPGDVYWSLITGMFADRPAGRDVYGLYSAGAVAGLRGEWSEPVGPPFGRPVATVNGVDLDIYAGVGPAPGFMVETGAVKGVGSIAVPMVPHDANIDVYKPDGAVMSCHGRADEIGNFTCPDSPLVFDQPGVYRVDARFSEGQHEGTCAGAPGGSYQIYAVDAGSAHRVLFDDSLPGPVKTRDRIAIRGRVEPPIDGARVFYSVVAPGILIDEGQLSATDGHFELTLLPDELGAQFANLHDHPHLEENAFMHRLLDLPLARPFDTGDRLQLLLHGLRDRKLSDTLEVTVFVQGTDEGGQPATAGGKLVLRGDRVVVPPAFLDGGEHP